MDRATGVRAPLAQVCLGCVAVLAACAPPQGEAPPSASQASAGLSAPKGTSNNPPTVFPLLRNLEANTPLLLELRGEDLDGDELTFSIFTAPQNGSTVVIPPGMEGVAPGIVYTPNNGFNGVEVFSYRAFDGTDHSQAAEVRLFVGNVNLPPGSVSQALSTPANTPLPLTLQGNDPEGAALSYTVLTQPTKGTLTGTAPNLTYRPNNGALGNDAFTFKVNDGVQDSPVATISLTVGDAGNPPLALAGLSTTTVNQPVVFDLGASDEDGDPLTYTIVTQPAHGSLSCNGRRCTYTPANGYDGWDLVEFRVSDGRNTSNLGQHELFVSFPNRAPVAQLQEVRTPRNTAASVRLVGSDADNDPITYVIARQPEFGALTGTAPNLTYTPSANFEGVDTFYFQVRDARSSSEVAAVTVLVGNVNRAPLAISREVAGTEGQPVSLTLTGFDPDGDGLSFAVVGQPLFGDLTGTAPNLTYTPDPDFAGVDAFTFTASDGRLVSATGTLALRIADVNDPPLAQSASFDLAEDQPLRAPFPAEDIDEGDVLTFSILAQPANGEVQIDGGAFVYTPDPDYAGTDMFSFRANDGTASSATAFVSLRVLGLDDPPVAQGASATVAEDGQVSVTLRATDPDGDALTYSVVSAPSQGVLSGTPPNLIYRPNLNYVGEDSFSFRANDANGASQPAAVRLTVTPVNDAPQALPGSAVTRRGEAVEVVLGAVDVDGDVLTYQLVGLPQQGGLTGTAPNLTYTPNANFEGTDAFTFRVRDGALNSNTATVEVVVLPPDAPNAPPTVQGLMRTVAEDAPLAVTLLGSDPNGDALVYEVVSPPSRGTLLGQPPALVYQGAANFHGQDSFTYRATDGALSSTNATVTITVTPVNDLPLAQDLDARGRPNEPVSIVLQASDAEEDALTYAVVEQPTRGALSGTAPALVYTPQQGFEGEDRFTYRARDAQGGSNVATVTILVQGGVGPNRAPSATPQAVTVEEDGQAAVTLAGTDPDNDALSFEVVEPPQRGVLLGAPPALTYAPRPDATGTDNFTFRALDAGAASPPATVTITITPANDPPSALGASLTLRPPGPFEVILQGTDPDGDALTYEVTAQPEHGTLSGTPPALSYQPAPGYRGPDAFSFRARDGRANSEPATVALLVLADDQPNRAPVARSQALSVDENGQRAFTLDASDPDGDSLSLDLFAPPQKGALVGQPPALTYLAAPNAAGTDTFSYTVSDGRLSSQVATVTVTITPINDPPVAYAQRIYTPEGQAVTLTLIGQDPEGSALTFELLERPTNGALSGTPPRVTYTPNARYHGDDTFTFRARDGQLSSEPATVTITVVDDNQPPTAQDVALNATEGQPSAFSLRGADPDDDPLLYLIQTTPRLGALSGTAPNLTYTPRPGAAGVDTFSYAVDDGDLTSAPATVTITIAALDRDPPTLEITTLGGWYNAPTAVEAEVLDDRCELRPGVVAFPAQVGVQVLPNFEEGWLAQSAPLPAGVWSLNLTAVSPCSAKRGADDLLLGVDDQAPALDVLFVSQAGVDPALPDTWSAVEDFAQLPIPKLRANDPLSGLAHLSARLVQVDGEDEEVTELLEQDLDLDEGALPLPVGPGSALLDLCVDAQLCQGGRLRTSALSASYFYFEVEATDQLGNRAVRRAYFQLLDLTASLNQWRRNLAQRNSAVPAVEASLTLASDRLLQAPALLQNQQLGALLMMLEDIASVERRAVALDPRLSRSTVGAQVALLALGLLEERWAEQREDGADPYLDELVLAWLDEARQTPLDDVGSVADAFLSLQQAWFHMSLAGQDNEPADFARALALVRDLRQQLSTLATLQNRLGYSGDGLVALALAVNDFGAWLQGLETTLVALDAEGPGVIGGDEHLNRLLEVQQWLGALKGLEEAPLWVRNWQWSLALVSVPFLEHLQREAEGVDAISDALANHGRGYGRDSLAYRDALLVEDTFALTTRQVCLSYIYFNLASGQASPLPAACCPEARSARVADPSYAIPAECR